MKPKKIELYDEIISLVMLALLFMVPFGFGVAVGLIIAY
jgi:hypothetical protein